jgi:CubicO group peptidase (beta-lactamase class C family)
MRHLCLFVCFIGVTPCGFSYALAAPFQARTPAKQAALAPSHSTAVDRLFDSFADRKHPGLAIGVMRDGKPVLMKGYRMADIQQAIPITSSTIFRIGSVTKSFTAIAILQLVERGKLSLDDPVANYLPDFPRGDQIRIRNLLSHTAGVPDFVSYQQAKKMPLEFQPGTRINYSNTGFNMLGMILEKVSGQKYEDYLRHNIFQPAEMVHSGYDRTVDLPGRARGYLLDEKGAYNPIPPGDAAGAFAAGGLYSNIEDLLRWEKALEDGKLLKRETLEKASTPFRLADGRHTGYGFGFMTSQYRGLREVGHGGDIDGFNAYVARYQDRHFAVIVLSNTGMRPPGPVPDGAKAAHQIAEVYLGGFMSKPETMVAVQVPPAVLDSYVGRYEIEAPDPIVEAMGRSLTIMRDGNHLVAESKMGKVPLAASSENTFRAAGSPAELTFVRDMQGKATHIIISLMGLREFPAHRVD